MKPTLKGLAAAAIAALAFPALAADDDWILKQMARTDGDPLGQFYKPIPGNQRFAASNESELAFLTEMQRTDGYVTEPKSEEAPARNKTETASR